MARKPLIRSSVLPYHVSARSNNRETFPVKLSDMWELLGSECLSVCLKFGVQIQSLVLMPNHFHMLIRAPNEDLGIVMNDLMSNLTKKCNRASGRSGHLFGGPYYPSIIQTSRYYGHAFKYVYRNPVKAKLCVSVEEYPYSTLYGLLGNAHLPFPVFPPRSDISISLPAEETMDLLPWLNKPFPKEAESIIQRGLKNSVFDKLFCRQERREYEVLCDLI
jgi:putative transposase